MILAEEASGFSAGVVSVVVFAVTPLLIGTHLLICTYFFCCILKSAFIRHISCRSVYFAHVPNSLPLRYMYVNPCHCSR